MDTFCLAGEFGKREGSLLWVHYKREEHTFPTMKTGCRSKYHSFGWESVKVVAKGHPTVCCSVVQQGWTSTPLCQNRTNTSLNEVYSSLRANTTLLWCPRFKSSWRFLLHIILFFPFLPVSVLSAPTLSTTDNSPKLTFFVIWLCMTLQVSSDCFMHLKAFLDCDVSYFIIFILMHIFS